MVNHMEVWIRRIDILSKSIGHAFSWCVLILTASTCFEVFMRYVLNSPTVWAFDMSYMLYGALFMMSGGLCRLAQLACPRRFHLSQVVKPHAGQG